MEIISNRTKFTNADLRTVKVEPELIIIGDDDDIIDDPCPPYMNSTISYLPANFNSEEIEIKPDTKYYINHNDSYTNGYHPESPTYNNTSSNYWSQSEQDLKYEYKEPEENFISVDDLKIKPFLYDLIKKPKKEVPNLESLKESFEITVKYAVDDSKKKQEEEEEEEDDDVILIEDDVDYEEIDDNDAGIEVDWMSLEQTGENREVFECFLCNKKVASAYNLRRHMMIHTGERPFGCDICTKRFREFSDLKKHRRKHANEAGFVCMVCRQRPPSLKNPTKCSTCAGKDVRTRTNYGDIELTDIPCMVDGGSKKAYICPVCDRIFGSRHNLKRHFMIHTGEKPYKCDVCNKCFREVSTLKKHMLTHSRIKLFKCNICGKEYSDFGSYTRHKNTHTESMNQYDTEKYDNSDEENYLFECGECHKKFTSVSVYKDHFKLHSGFSFQCYICKTMFRTKEKLNAHIVIHDYDDSD